MAVGCAVRHRELLPRSSVRAWRLATTMLAAGRKVTCWSRQAAVAARLVPPTPTERMTARSRPVFNTRSFALRQMSVFRGGSDSKSQARMLQTARKQVFWNNLLGMTFLGFLAMVTFDREVRSTWVYHQVADWMSGLLRGKDPEEAHRLAIEILDKGMGIIDSDAPHPALAQKVMGMKFSNPVGMAAGFDKNAEVLGPLFDMGFGFVEVGGLTPFRQMGNPKPRVFRLPEDKAVINRYGLNSDGARVVSNRLMKATRDFSQLDPKRIIGVNIAANTSSEDKIRDYCEVIESVGRIVDFVVLNLSCPNTAFTANLANDEDAMAALVQKVVAHKNDMIASDNKFFKMEKEPPRLLLKISPDMDDQQKEHIARIALENKVDGLVVANTTSSRPESLKGEHAKEAGGLSGPPVKELALQTCRDMYKLTGGQIPIVGVGGISTAEDAYERIRAGASLVQFYTAMTYEGPTITIRMKKRLVELLQADGFDNISQAVGADVK